mmetsp:Transcript_114285/g.243748  ORF Transcript_114285/g.243748 Transcript_114285/m.243748 type:complete len:265 (+) Transcript_114285:118-912(+)
MKPPPGLLLFAAALVVGQGSLRPKGTLTVRSMRVAGAQGSKIYLGAQDEFSIGTDAAGTFSIQQASQTAPLLSLDAKDTLHLGAKRVEAQELDAVRGFSVGGVQQWRLVRSEDFALSGGGLGWSRQAVSQCGGVHMLGGYCQLSSGEVNKTFTGLPPHKQLRVRATYHFIDRWIGEAGYMKLDIGQEGRPVVVWSEQHSQQMSKGGVSLCGQSGTPEGKFSASIDVTVPHRQDAVQLAFGSTMDSADPCDESWGVSGVELYMRG